MLLLNADSKAVGEFQQTNFNTSYVVIKRDGSKEDGNYPLNFNTSYVVIKRRFLIHICGI